MTNNNPLWKTLLLAAVLIVGALFALPNLFGSDPAVQVSARSAELTSQDVERFNKLLADAGFDAVEIRQEEGRYLALFGDEEADSGQGSTGCCARPQQVHHGAEPRGCQP